jgi:hypothetical protein
MKRNPTIILAFVFSILFWAMAPPAAAEPRTGGKARSASHGKARSARKRGKARSARKRGKSSAKKRSAKARRQAAARNDERGTRPDEQAADDDADREVTERAEVGTVARTLVGESDQGHTAAGSGMRHSRHMEFDARLVRGETAGTGAVVLFDRGERQLPRLTRLRDRFLRATIEPVLGKREVAAPAASEPKEAGKQAKVAARPTAGEDGSRE